MQNKGRILVVEDDEFIGSMLARALKTAGYEVRYESTTEDILAKISGWAPDVTMLDNNLPGMTGLEILEEVKKQQMTTQVVMLTADDSVGTSVKAMKLGASDYLVKPFNPENLIPRVERLYQETVAAAGRRIEVGAEGARCEDVAVHRVDLVDDDGAHRGEHATAAVAGEQDEQRLRRGDEDVRRLLAERSPLLLWRVAGAHAHSHLSRGGTQPVGGQADAGQRRAQVAVDVVDECLER